jgi:dTDP-4-dehydrorhamnose reductase
VIESHPDLTGLYHVAAAPISKFDLLLAFNDAFGCGHQIRPVDQPEVNRALDGGRFEEATGITVPSWDAMIAEVAGDEYAPEVAR